MAQKNRLVVPLDHAVFDDAYFERRAAHVGGENILFADLRPRNWLPTTPEVGPDSMVPTAFLQVAAVPSTPPYACMIRGSRASPFDLSTRLRLVR